MVKNFLIVLRLMQQKLHQAEATGDLISNKIADKITGVSKKPAKELQNNEIEVDAGRTSPKDLGRASPKELPKKDTYLQKKDNKLLMN